MATLKADVTLQDSLCEQIAAIAHEMQISQNELVRLAIVEYVQNHDLSFSAATFQESWKQANNGQTLSLSQLWEDTDLKG